MLRNPESRLRLISLLLIALLLLVVGQLVRLQVFEHPRYVAEAKQMLERQYSLPAAPMGKILDSNGALLVGNLPVFEVDAYLERTDETETAIPELAVILNRPEAELRTALTFPETYTGTHVWAPLARDVTSDTLRQVRAMNLRWVTITPTWKRYYAEGALAAHVLGFANAEGYGYGVQAYQWRLIYTPPEFSAGAISGQNEPLPEEVARRSVTPVPGVNLRLTINRTIQAYVEGELDKALVEYQAEAGTIIVMNPQTGEILAMVSRPSYEPSRYADYAATNQSALFVDPAISKAYEPGSVFKLITVASALDAGLVDTNWTYEDTGMLEYGGVVARNWDRAAHGVQDLEGLLARSLNVGAATLTTRVLGAERFYKSVAAFGFGQLTNVELANEAQGLVHMPADWDWQDGFLVTNSFGQGIAVTPLQMAAAVAAIANDGVMMRPHIVAERISSDGNSVLIAQTPIGQPISAEAAQTLTELMARAMETRMKQATVPGYRIAGKSGTAQIPVSGGYDPDDIIASFVGFGPLPDPQVLILVKLDRPAIDPLLRWGSQTAAPLFQRIAARLFVLLQIPPTE
ncbi:MAG: Stage V sporulation protein D [Chloroflexi bacterium ADurb.Bin360]|nr:MAG: Stage V sporulation protein D [Chloroflexi bacterium ADurb.Bin360]